MCNYILSLFLFQQILWQFIQLWTLAIENSIVFKLRTDTINLNDSEKQKD